MKKFSIKQILFVLFIGGLLFAAYAVVRAFIKGERTLQGLISAPFTAAGEAWTKLKSLGSSAANAIASSTPVQGVIAAASLPAITDASTQLTGVNQTDAFNDYAPGGRLYNQIAAQQGVAAADANWQIVQQHYAAENAQDTANSSWFGLGNIFSF